MYVLILSIIILGIIVYLIHLVSGRPSGEDQPKEGEKANSRPACGLSDVCHLDCAIEALKEEPDYYEDEELDAYKGIASNAYTDEQIEQFDEVLTTLSPKEVHGWLRSLGLRGIALPDDLKDAAYMLVREQAEGIV